MPITLNKKAYLQLLKEDLEWLNKQPQTLERNHVRDCIKWMMNNRRKVIS